MGEAELVEGDNGSAVGSDLHESDLGEGGCGEESEDGEEREESNGGHFRLSLSLSGTGVLSTKSTTGGLENYLCLIKL